MLCRRSRPNRNTVFAIVLLSLLSSAALRAQAIAGIWQGTLPLDKDPRIVLKIAQAEGEPPRAVFYWIDREATSVGFTMSGFNEGEFLGASDILGVSFKGRLSADGASMTGTWTQDKHSYPLTLARTAPGSVWTYGDPSASIPMAADADPAFEVASIKPSAPDGGNLRYDVRTRRFGAHNATVTALIRYAFQLSLRQISGAPAWMAEDRFDIAAQPDTPGLPNEDQYRSMVRKLLADRFQLSFHTVEQTFPVYALTADHDGAKLTPGNPDFDGHGHITQKILPDEDTEEVRFVYTSMAEVANILMNFIEDRQVVDETGLDGRYDFTLKLTDSVLVGPDKSARTADFVRALQPLGFRLVPRKEPLKVMVIEDVKRPSAN